MNSNLICSNCGQPVASANKPHMNCSPELSEKIATYLYSMEPWEPDEDGNPVEWPNEVSSYLISKLHNAADAIIALLTGEDKDELDKE